MPMHAGDLHVISTLSQPQKTPYLPFSGGIDPQVCSHVYPMRLEIAHFKWTSEVRSLHNRSVPYNAELRTIGDSKAQESCRRVQETRVRLVARIAGRTGPLHQEQRFSGERTLRLPVDNGRLIRCLLMYEALVADSTISACIQFNSITRCCKFGLCFVVVVDPLPPHPPPPPPPLSPPLFPFPDEHRG